MAPHRRLDILRIMVFRRPPRRVFGRVPPGRRGSPRRRPDSSPIPGARVETCSAVFHAPGAVGRVRRGHLGDEAAVSVRSAMVPLKDVAPGGHGPLHPRVHPAAPPRRGPVRRRIDPGRGGDSPIELDALSRPSSTISRPLMRTPGVSGGLGHGAIYRPRPGPDKRRGKTHRARRGISEERDGPGDIPAPSATSPGAVGDARGQHPEHPTKTP